MPSYLTFLMHAPIAAAGDQAMNLRRGTWLRPGRSAVLGLIAACLGLDRADEDAHAELQRDYHVALRVEHCGPMLRDFHTTQMPAHRRGVHYATRREELQAVDDNDPVVTERYYVQGLTCVFALWQRGFARWTFEEIAQAMREPHWVPYFGRLCCPLALPLDPQIADADTPVAALAERAASDPGLRLLRLRGDDPVATMDAADADAFGLFYQRVERRRDALRSRQRWQFDLREEAVL